MITGSLILDFLTHSVLMRSEFELESTHVSSIFVSVVTYFAFVGTHRGYAPVLRYGPAFCKLKIIDQIIISKNILDQPKNYFAHRPLFYLF